MRERKSSHSGGSLSYILLVFQFYAADAAIVVVTVRIYKRARKEKYQIRLQRKRVVTMMLFAGRCAEK